MDNGSIVKQEVWDSGYKNWKLGIVDDDMVTFIADVLKNEGLTGNLFEVGGFPFRYSAPLCKKFDLELNCVDKTNAFDVDECKKYFESARIKYGELINSDFWQIYSDYKEKNKRFNVVCSFGFIEHFKNWREVLKMHCDLVEEGGFLIITAPNFRGWIQKVLHMLFDLPNLRLHVLDAMQPMEWGKIAREEGFKLLFEGFIGGFEFWGNGMLLGKFRRFMLSIVCFICNRVRKMVKHDRGSYSAYCVLIARKG